MGIKREHIWAHHEHDATMNWKLLEGGYPSRMSVRQGEEIALHISNSRSYYDIFVFREGAQRQLVQTISGLQGGLQEVPDLGYEQGFGWQSVTSFTVPDDWSSGVYIATFATGQGLREILFVVRSGAPRAPLLLTIASNTYQAYNNVGGKCFYDYVSTARQHAKVLSFERPLPIDWFGNFYIWDQFFVSWLEAAGYEVDYCINGDHDAEPDLLGHYKANLRIGHDEYNSRDECLQLQEFVRQGGNLILFGGNCFYHEIELRHEQRQIYCSKPYYHDWPTPEKPETSYLCFLDDLRQRTIGVFYTSYINTKTADPHVFQAPTTEDWGYYRVADADHWVFAGTGLAEGDEFGREDSIVGVEADAADIEFVDGRPRYTGSDGVSPEYRIIALAKCIAPDGRMLVREGGKEGLAECYGTVAINESEFVGTVFNAATIEWGHGLYREGVVAQITRNVLDRLAR
jgi:hypothetical protein